MSRNWSASPVLLLCAASLSIPAAIARAGAVIELRALTPENAPGGYLPGTAVEFRAGIRRTDVGGGAIQLRLVTLDFSASSPELTFVGDFMWDFTDYGPFYMSFPEYPKPNLTYTTGQPQGFILQIPAAPGGSLVLGAGRVTLPAGLGDYTLDALNAASTTVQDSARIDFDFTDPTTWLANGLGNDLITGDPLVLTVVPEPATLVLLAVCGLTITKQQHRTHRLRKLRGIGAAFAPQAAETQGE